MKQETADKKLLKALEWVEDNEFIIPDDNPNNVDFAVKTPDLEEFLVDLFNSLVSKDDSKEIPYIATVPPEALEHLFETNI